MITLIAESKTMSSCAQLCSPTDWEKHSPVTQPTAEEIMWSLRDFTPQELAETVKVSGQMGVKLAEMIRDFPLRNCAQKAIEAFTGVVFRAFGFDSIKEAGRAYTSSNVRIISSLYGYLRPDDLVRPYRFDFKTPLAPGREKFSSFWKDAVTGFLLEELACHEDKTIIDLLPRDAAMSIDFRRIKKVASMMRVDFRDMKTGGSVATPHSGRLKMLRGALLREIAERRMTSVADLKKLSCDQFAYWPERSSENSLVFLT